MTAVEMVALYVDKLCHLLIEKGLISEDEYQEVLYEAKKAYGDKT